jgi:hypothetical protein
VALVDTSEAEVMARQPLWYRLYSRQPYIELARAIGWRGLPLPEARRQVKRLEEQFGRKAMEEAAEIVAVDPSQDPPWVRLSEECRKHCGALLGPPPAPGEAPAEPVPAGQPR